MPLPTPKGAMLVISVTVPPLPVEEKVKLPEPWPNENPGPAKRLLYSKLEEAEPPKIWLSDPKLLRPVPPLFTGRTPEANVAKVTESIPARAPRPVMLLAEMVPEKLEATTVWQEYKSWAKLS